MDWRENASTLSELADKFYSMPGKLLYSDDTFVLSVTSLSLPRPVLSLRWSFMVGSGQSRAGIGWILWMTGESLESWLALSINRMLTSAVWMTCSSGLAVPG